MFYTFQHINLSSVSSGLFLSILIFRVWFKSCYFFTFLFWCFIVDVKSTSSFCILILYPAALLNLPVRGVLLGVLGFSMYTIMPSVLNDNFTSSLSILMPFISFSHVIAVADFPMLCWIELRVGILALFQIWAGSLSLSPFSIILMVGLSQIACITLGCVPAILTLARLFIIMHECWILSNALSASIGINVLFVFYIYGESCWLICVRWIIIVILGWITLGRSIWSLSCVVEFDLLIFCWEFLHLYSSKNVIFFFHGVFIWFWYQGDDGFMLIECFEECSLFFSLRRSQSLRRFSKSFSFYVW